MKKLICFVMALLSMVCPVKAEDEGLITLGTSIYVYSAIADSVPYKWAYHDVLYETAYCTDPIIPNWYECTITGVANTSFERTVVIPEVICEGEYRLHPTAMTVGCFQQTGIRSIDFRAHIRTIPQNAFSFCTDLQTVKFSNDCPHIVEAEAFKGCQKLNSIKFPAQLRYIGDHAFDGCLSLSEIYIPKDVAYLGEAAFNHCTTLSKVTFATGRFRSIPDRCFYNCEKLEHIEIPEGVGELGVASFQLSGLKSIVLPASMRLICNEAFSNTPLTDIYCKALEPPRVGLIWTADQLRQMRLHVPQSAVNAYRDDPVWSHFGSIEPTVFLDYIQSID